MKTYLLFIFSLMIIFVLKSSAIAGSIKGEYFCIGSGCQPRTEYLQQVIPRDIRTTRAGVSFLAGSVASTPPFSSNGLSPMPNPTSATPFKIDWNYPGSSVSILVGDNNPDADTIVLKAFNCNNQQIGQLNDALPGGSTSFVTKTLRLAAAGVCSIEIIGGSSEQPHSVYYADLKIITPLDNLSFEAMADFTTDFTIFRPNGGAWWSLFSAFFQPQFPYNNRQFGLAADKIVPGDYRGDNVTDFAVFRNGNWFISENCAVNDSTCSQNAFRAINFGAVGDIPTPFDYDLDGKTDAVVFHPSNGTWYGLRSSDNQFFAQQFGTNGDVPVIGNYDGDGLPDIAVFRGGNWFVLQSSDNQFRAVNWGVDSDIPAPGDYDDEPSNPDNRPEGKANIAVFRPSNGTWYVLTANGFNAVQWGTQGDVPISYVINQ